MSEPDDTPEPVTDPEILALLDFEPVPREIKRPNGWTPALQRLFIIHLATLGTPGKAARAMDKALRGIMDLYEKEEAVSFRASWDAAIALFEERDAKRIEAESRARASFVAPMGAPRKSAAQRDVEGRPHALPGQVLNEHGEYEDEDSLRRRAEDARDSIGGKLIRIRRLYLQEISRCPGKRAAFEILTELPVDWDIAERGEPQPFEPWTRTNARQPDMVLTAESGWSFGEFGYGPDRKAEARRAIDEYRAEHGLPAITWDGGEG